ncbi:SDR family oxidoreductase [Novosphingobium bradum]|uniref:SDR family oxidoreductase n=1 Tax=Novosphingobium bradum TaxID=1737444 RepID=A0ABV7IS03_9SPHN
MHNHVEGKVIAITGAGSGFGRLTAQKAAALGARVLCIDIDLASAQAVAEGIGAAAVAVRADVSQIEDMRAAIAVAVERFGRVDVMVNNAGTMPLAFLADHEAALAAWNRCIDINFKGVMNGTVAVHDQMIAQGSGHVINLSSIYGNFPLSGAAVYGATKAAVDYFSHAVRQESQGKIKVTVIKPSGVSSTGLAGSVVNAASAMGIFGHNAPEALATYARIREEGLVPPGSDSIGYFSLEADYIADAIIHAINQPLGVAISDITVRAAGDLYIP